MRKLRTQAIGQVRPRARDPRATLLSVARGRRGPWGQLAMRHRRREARARSFDRNQPLSSSASPTFGGRRFSDRIRSKRSVRRRVPERGRRRVDRRSYSKHNSPFFAPALTGQGRGDDRGSSGGARCKAAPSFFHGRRSRKAATWLILPVVICLSQRLSHACLSINCFIL